MATLPQRKTSVFSRAAVSEKLVNQSSPEEGLFPCTQARHFISKYFSGKKDIT